MLSQAVLHELIYSLPIAVIIIWVGSSAEMQAISWDQIISHGLVIIDTMIGIKSIPKVLLCILLIAPILCLFPNPKKVELLQTPLKLATNQYCAQFSYHI